MLSAHSIVYGGFDVNGITFFARLFMVDCSHLFSIDARSQAGMKVQGKPFISGILAN